MIQQQQQPEKMKEAVQTVGEAVGAVEDEDDDCISTWDWSQAFLQALQLAFDEDLPPKFASYRPYKGAKPGIFKLLGSLYVMSQAPMAHNFAWLQLDGRNRLH